MTDLKKLIARLAQERRERNIVPEHVPETDIRKAVYDETTKELNSLYASGEIKVSRLVNGNAVTLTDKQT